MVRFVSWVIAERVELDATVIRAIHNPTRGHLGARVLPWTTELAWIVGVTGTPGETFDVRTEVVSLRDPEWLLFWRNSQATISQSGDTQMVLIVGPMEFRHPGTYEFRLYLPNESKATTAELTGADGR